MSKLVKFIDNKKKQKWILNIYDLKNSKNPVHKGIKNEYLFFFLNKLNYYEPNIIDIIITFIDFDINKIYTVNMFKNRLNSYHLKLNTIHSTLLTQLHIYKKNLYILTKTFCNCNNLSFIELSGFVVSIAKNCFSNCIHLTTIKITSKTDVYLADYNFFNCYRLRSLIIRSLSCLISSYSFVNCYYIKYIYLPFGTILCPYSLPNNSSITINSHPVSEIIKMHFNIRMDEIYNKYKKIYDIDLEKYKYNSLELKAKKEQYF